jgi:hypothetical protein
MKIYKPQSIKEAIDRFQQFLECDLWSRFMPQVIKREVWYRDDMFKREKDLQEYLQFQFDILRKEIKRLGKKK